MKHRLQKGFAVLLVVMLFATMVPFTIALAEGAGEEGPATAGVALNRNDGSGALLSAALEVNADGTATIQLPGIDYVTLAGQVGEWAPQAPLRFVGWNTAPDGGGSQYAPGDTVTVAANAQLSLYAMYQDESAGGSAPAFLVRIDAGGRDYTEFYNYKAMSGGDVVYGGPAELTLYQGIPMGDAAPHDPSRPGYAFLGWVFDGQDYTLYNREQLAQLNPTGVLNGVTIYAAWRRVQTYTVTFDAGEGSPKTTTAAAVAGGTVQMPAAPTHPSKIFTGWYQDSGASVPWNFANDTVNGDITLHAGWIQGAKVHFHPNNGEGVIERTHILPGSTITPPDPAPVYEGHVLVGWYTNNGNNPKQTDRWNFESNTVEGNNTLNLFAHWAEVLTVRFDTGGGSEIAPLTDVAKGTTIGAPADPTRGEDVFAGWYGDAGHTRPWNFSTDKVQGSMTLYGDWLPAAAQAAGVVYHQNVGDGSLVSADPAEYEVGGDAGVLALPEGWQGEGWRFTGWNTEPDGSGQGYAAGGAITELEGTVELYAQWDVAVTYYLNYLGSTTSRQVFYPRGSIDVPNYSTTNPGPGFSRQNDCNLRGWNTSADASGAEYAVGEGAQITLERPLELYAVWTARLTYEQVYYGAVHGWAKPSETVIAGTVALRDPDDAENGDMFAGWQQTATNEFVGWSRTQSLTDANGAPVRIYAPGEELVVRGGTTLYAVYRPHIQYDEHRGSYRKEQYGPLDYGTPQQLLSAEQAAEAFGWGEDFIRDFYAWRYGGKLYFPGEDTLTLRHNITVYAVYAQGVTFHHNYRGSTRTVDLSLPQGETVPGITDEAFSRFNSGYKVEFAGWNTAPDGSGAWYGGAMNGADYGTKLAAGVTDLYAIWKTTLRFLPTGMVGHWFDIDNVQTKIEVIDSQPMAVPDITDALFENWDYNTKNGLDYNRFVGWSKHMYDVVDGRPAGDETRYSADGSYGAATITPVGPTELRAVYIPRVVYLQGGFGGWGNPYVNMEAPYTAEYTVAGLDDALFAGWNIPADKTFRGWYIPGGDGTVYRPGESITVYSNTELRVSYELNTTLHRNRTTTDAVRQAVSLGTGQRVPGLGELGLGAWQEYGSTFRGWNTKPDGSGAWYGGSISGTGYVENIGTSLPADLYAIYTIQITYASNGATIGPNRTYSYLSATDPAEYIKGYPVAVQDPYGALFTGAAGWDYFDTIEVLGWNTQQYGASTAYAHDGVYGENSFTASRNVTLYAIYKPHIMYHRNGQGGYQTLEDGPLARETQVAVRGRDDAMFDEWRLPAGVEFVGWNTQREGKGDWYDPSGLMGPSTVSLTKSLKLYAIYGRAITDVVTGYTGTYDGSDYGPVINGGQGASAGVRVSYAPSENGVPGAFQAEPLTRGDAGRSEIFVKLEGEGLATRIVPVEIVLEAAPLTVQVHDFPVAITVGDAVPNFDNHTFTVDPDGTQLAPGDTAEVVKGDPALRFVTAYDVGDLLAGEAGVYNLTLNNATADNYDLTILAGKLTVLAPGGTQRPGGPGAQQPGDVLDVLRTDNTETQQLFEAQAAAPQRPELPQWTGKQVPDASFVPANNRLGAEAIGGGATPTTAPGGFSRGSTIALLNIALLALGLGILGALTGSFLRTAAKRRGTQAAGRRGRNFLKLLGLPLFLAALLLFLFTQDPAGSLVLADNVTPLMALVPVAMLLAGVLSMRHRAGDEAEAPEEIPME